MWQEVKNQWQQGGMLIRLVLINCGVFLIVTTLQLLATLGFGDSSPVESSAVLGLATTWIPDLLIRRPWTVITHMFVHTGIWHLLMNMALLFWMGRLFMVHFGSRRLLSTYIVGGLAGFVLYFIATNVFPGLQQGTYAYGASAAVMAILVAVATRDPDRRIGLILLGAVPLKYVAIALILLDYFALSNGENTGGNLAHLGGALFGYVMVKQADQGRDLVGWFERMLDSMIMAFKPNDKSKLRVEKRPNRTPWSRRAKKDTRSSRVKSDADFNQEKKDRLARMDAILDKVSKHGYDNLTKEEKASLFQASKKE
ncbi:MAG: rhomboid family intramembrane serine protease [Flavobacteriales bacterium]|nr:rhomboid family intramembrane serine protease [Flavobacteriales bacterium]